MERGLEKKIKKSKINPTIVTREIEDFVIKQIVEAGATGGVLGLSGGIDSTTVAYLAKRAFDRYNATIPDKSENVKQQKQQQLGLYGLIMPAGDLNSDDTKDAISVAEELDIEYRIVDIEPILQVRQQQNPKVFSQEYHRGNGASRERMVQLYGEACDQEKLVLGTGNKDEDYGIKYFTKYGDGGVDISPLGNLSKRLVREVARYIGVPEKRVNRMPTARLFPGQSDEGELGYGYDIVEKVIEGFDQNFDREQIQGITGYKLEVIDNIRYRHTSQKHKMRMPPVAEITLQYE